MTPFLPDGFTRTPRNHAVFPNRSNRQSGQAVEREAGELAAFGERGGGQGVAVFFEEGENLIETVYPIGKAQYWQKRFAQCGGDDRGSVGGSSIDRGFDQDVSGLARFIRRDGVEAEKMDDSGLAEAPRKVWPCRISQAFQSVLDISKTDAPPLGGIAHRHGDGQEVLLNGHECCSPNEKPERP
ncbi:hypothetical protein OVA07_02955 [Novosphingobium sp. SL115]|uniref:hypothetical protein n=1 Tax=Novosphingobium sp. SL115 TaxID=2995150 RepID=UPI0022751B8F|nr:hypothetical protein [Novosphingobium sp. SL115]MCY1669967.1 hypothetical protein [Novosphingobium sp. SL115]